MKRFGKAYDYFTCIKITKLAVTIIKNLQVGYEYIPFLIKYSENENVGWQKQIGIEALGELISDKDFLGDLFLKNTSMKIFLIVYLKYQMKLLIIVRKKIL